MPLHVLVLPIARGHVVDDGVAPHMLHGIGLGDALAAKVESIDGHEGLKFENAALAYQAASNGLGVMMGLTAFVQDDLARGLLTAPFDFSVATKGGYYISFSDAKEKSQRSIEFENWLLEEISLPS